MSSFPVDVFYSYSHKDERLQEKLEEHLTILEKQGIIKGWHDRKILPSSEWKEEIDDHLNKAHIILLLVSPSFIASDYCYGVEMKRAMERHLAKEARVIPIILRPVAWHNTPFSKLQALPRGAKPVV